MEITTKILGIAVGGALKTRIMYGAHLSFPQAQEYLRLLQDEELLEYSRDEKLYHTTQKGRVFLKDVMEMQRLLVSNNENAILLAD